MHPLSLLPSTSSLIRHRRNDHDLSAAATRAGGRMYALICRVCVCVCVRACVCACVRACFAAPLRISTGLLSLVRAVFTLAWIFTGLFQGLRRLSHQYRMGCSPLMCTSCSCPSSRPCPVSSALPSSPPLLLSLPPSSLTPQRELST
jgi:hypothetical protein